MLQLLLESIHRGPAAASGRGMWNLCACNVHGVFSVRALKHAHMP